MEEAGKPQRSASTHKTEMSSGSPRKPGPAAAVDMWRPAAHTAYTLIRAGLAVGVSMTKYSSAVVKLVVILVVSVTHSPDQHLPFCHASSVSHLKQPC